MKINRIAVTRGPGAACPPDGSGRVLAKGDDDVVAEGLELAAGVAGLATAVGVLGVPVRSGRVSSRNANPEQPAGRSRVSAPSHGSG